MSLETQGCIMQGLEVLANDLFFTPNGTGELWKGFK